MLRFRKEECNGDLFELLKLVAVERLRFSDELLNINSFSAKIEKIKYQTVIDYGIGVAESYETLEELQDSETLVLIFTYLIKEGIHHVYDEDLDNNVEMFGSVYNALSYTITNDLYCLFEETEEGEE
jgi:hypothetical protein